VSDSYKITSQPYNKNRFRFYVQHIAIDYNYIQWRARGGGGESGGTRPGRRPWGASVHFLHPLKTILSRNLD